ncbi:MAG: DNA internalization-related competence protein ComEC/Rec2, partial [Proteobacteria bacterium]|nr:DNA internalization-related competence protein ComEC/Rec2 [Pseudomonadota bacterium]
NFPQKVRLSWYYGETVNAGETWQLEVRLKPPHGFMNPGGFDYEAWLFQQGIHATGYVRKSTVNRKLLPASAWSVDAYRQSVGQKIDSLADYRPETDTRTGSSLELPSDHGVYALVKALAIGDKSSISTKQWQVLAQTGTSHLMAISGLHIGLASLFAYVVVRRVLPAKVMVYVPAQHIALVAGLLAAVLYALLAGLSIPTQRAIIMLSALAVTVLLRRNIRPLDSMGFALILVLLFDPVAVLSAGFWFSFSAVAVIFICVRHAEDLIDIPWWKKALLILWQWIRLQLILSVFLLPLSLYMFQQASLVSPLANLILIPYVSFLVVPLILFAIVFSFIYQGIADIMFALAAWLLDLIWPFLQYLSHLPFAFWVKGDVSLLDCLLASTAMLVLYFSKDLSARIFVTVSEIRSLFHANRYTPFYRSADSSVEGSENSTDSAGEPPLWLLRLSACLLLLPLLISGQSTAELATAGYRVVILDVGQGSAAVVQTRNHVLVFDAGAAFSDKLNAGSGVIIPYLRSRNMQNIDRLIISHGDADHIGGAQVLLDSYPGISLIGQDIDKLQLSPVSVMQKQPCVAGLEWRWDGVSFVFLSPADASASGDGGSRGKKRNNYSCVLRVSSTAGSVLFTGDIEKKIEKDLLLLGADKLVSDVLIVAHHGSNTSSTSAFIRAVNPQLAIISAGYKNRYKLPSAKVVNRYGVADIPMLNTAEKGAISFRFLAHEGGRAGVEVSAYRQQAGKYWNHRDF